MASEIPEITERNQLDIISAQLAHVISDLDAALKMLRDQGVIQARHDRLLSEFAPLLAQFRTPLATLTTRRRRNG